MSHPDFCRRSISKLIRQASKIENAETKAECDRVIEALIALTNLPETSSTHLIQTDMALEPEVSRNNGSNGVPEKKRVGLRETKKEIE